MTANELWDSPDAAEWREALASYPAVIEAQGVRPLQELDTWYRDSLPGSIIARERAYITHDELVRVTEWKMARGIWRARNLALVRGNAPEAVRRASARALSAIPDRKTPIRELATLAGVGPATASAIASAAAPELYPFLDEFVAAQVPGLGKPEFTPAYYAKYADALRARARELGGDWTPTRVERALWANAGGKAGVRAK